MRTKDLAYQALLNRVRNGEGIHEDWLLLRTRVIGIGLHISLNDPPWNEVCYICNVSFREHYPSSFEKKTKLYTQNDYFSRHMYSDGLLTEKQLRSFECRILFYTFSQLL
jgi:hypothetical protein